MRTLVSISIVGLLGFTFLWYATDGGLSVLYDYYAKVVTGLDTTTGGGAEVAVNTYPLSAGKYYFEVSITTIFGASYPAVGVVDAAAKNSGAISGTLMAVQTPTANNLGGSGNIGGFIASSVICVAVDTASRKVWIRKNGDAWAGGGDPATGATPYKTLTGSGAILPYADVRAACSVGGRFASGHGFTIPSGFVVWG